MFFYATKGVDTMNDAEIRMQVKADDGGGFLKLGNNIKRCDKQAEFLKFKIDDLKVGIQQMESMPKDFGKGQIIKAKSELEKLENQYNALIGQQEATTKGVEKGMKKGIGSIKKIGLALFGIHSIWRMVSRASSAYMAQDTELANKMQAVWVGLGSMLAPIMEKIITWIIQAVKYLNVFIKALTGVDYLANAMAKSLNKAGKAGTKASKQLSGLDEITNIGDSGSTDLSWADAFKDIPIDTTFADKLTEIGKTIKNIWDTYFAPFFKLLKDN